PQPAQPGRKHRSRISETLGHVHRNPHEDLLHKDSLVAELCCYMRQASTFWKAELKPVADSDGELFFELIDQLVTYRLEPV
ncbi:hypothetical protein OFL38_07475, partial [Pseudomonas aeruginosa]|uniref:hypothetical protein n=1 Tax=Pseudomonas aeruginosa TaxID=287 RepID=UPI0021F18C05